MTVLLPQRGLADGNGRKAEAALREGDIQLSWASFSSNRATGNQEQQGVTEPLLNKGGEGSGQNIKPWTRQKIQWWQPAGGG